MTLVEFVEYLEKRNVPDEVRHKIVIAYGCFSKGLLFQREDLKGRSICALNSEQCIYQSFNHPKGLLKKFKFCKYDTQKTHLDEWISEEREYERLQT